MKRIFLVAAASLVLAALGIYWHHRQAAVKRLAQWEAERAAEPNPAVLSQPLSWQRAEPRLSEFADLIAQRSGLPVDIDAAQIQLELKWTNAPQSQKTRIPEGTFTLDEILRMVLRPMNLEADLRADKIVITTLSNSNRARPRTEVYPLPQPKPAGWSESDWQQVIQVNIAGHAVAVPGAVVVVADAASQKRARLVIDTICTLRDPVQAPVVIPPPTRSHAERRIRTELDRLTNVDFVEQPLQDVMLYLTELHDIPLIVLADKLREASVPLDTPVTKTLRGVSLRSALNLLLKDLELTFAVRDEALVITTPEDAEARVRTVALPVEDLLAADESADIEALEKLITSTIDTGTWRAFGGPALLQHVDDRWLIMQQTDVVADQVEALLATLRKMLASAAPLSTQPIVPPDFEEARIRAAIEQPIEVGFQSQPLKDVVMYFSEVLKVPIVLSLKKLEEANISADSPLTFKTAGPTPARVLLEQLAPSGIDFVVRDEVLQITTPEDAQSHLTTRVYDTRALLSQWSAMQLRDRITRTIQPGSWWDPGRGPGEAEVYRGLLVITHTDRVHEEIERLLKKLDHQ